MLFNSFEFIFLFFPAVFLIYFVLLHRQKITWSKIWLILASLIFYSWWNLAYLPVLLVSLVVNYFIRLGISNREAPDKSASKTLFVLGILFNIGLLGFFKYAHFFAENLNFFFHTSFSMPELALPLGLSFVTFVEIAYLVDCYMGKTKSMDFINYALLVTFFPHLIAGPIVHHKDLIPQFADIKNRLLNTNNIALGIFVFAIGLFKKVIVADTFALWANYGYDHTDKLTLLSGWITSLSYTFQLYYDFSGYTDMAIGLALFFNIHLPQNFNSPYKATSVQDFWRRWHITLSHFLRDYIYIPLGGNRLGELKTYRNLLLTFLIGGFWHGAGWNFIFWGFLHGAALITERIGSRLKLHLPQLLCWFLTFNFINVTWIFFRATSWHDALNVLKAMVGINGITLYSQWKEPLAFLKKFDIAFKNPAKGFVLSEWIWISILLALIVSLFYKNTNELAKEFKPTWGFLVTSVLFVTVSLLFLDRVSEFLYFDF